MAKTQTPKEIVLSFVSALNRKDYDSARRQVSDDLSFRSPVMEIAGAEEYFRQMRQLMIRYEIKKVFADGEDVCLFYDYTISGTTRFGCGWYKVRAGRIASLRILSDIPPGPQPPGR